MLYSANGDRTFTWDKVRQLSSVSDTNLQVDYTYDDAGIRTSKTANGVTTQYHTKDGVILAQSDGENTLYFQYDKNGIPFGFIWNGIQYYYVTNQIGDVMGITDTSKKLLVQYAYDARGAPTGVTVTDSQYYDLAEINPLRYRGYYYDSDTELYYLQSRYYDPNLCRFINADKFEIANQDKSVHFGENIYLYCYNEPKNNSDETGLGKKWIGFIVYSYPGSDFIKQANLMKKKCKGYNLVTYYCKSAKDFVTSWNAIAKKYKLKDLFLYVHGEAGKLYFRNCNILKSVNKKTNNKKKESLKDHQFSELKNLSITGKIYLNSCHGGTSSSGTESVASILAKKVPSHSVRAVVKGNVYYRGAKKPVMDGQPITKEKGAYWADFNYSYDKRSKKKIVKILNRRSYWKYD